MMVTFERVGFKVGQGYRNNLQGGKLPFKKQNDIAQDNEYSSGCHCEVVVVALEGLYSGCKKCWSPRCRLQA